MSSTVGVEVHDMAKKSIGVIFHGIGEPRRTLDPGEENYWLTTERFEAILDKIAAFGEDERIRISFDDGNESDFKIALPNLISRKLRADFFILTGRIDQTGSMTAEQIRGLVSSGMGVGSHGIHHRDWTQLDELELAAEITQSRSRLEELLRARVVSAGIPFGSYDARVLRALRRAGYASVYSSDGGSMSVTEFLRPRTSIRGDMRDSEVDTILTGRRPFHLQVRKGLSTLWKRFV
jgi:peptidoglycan/xylan/chitin deacetylase (PgdA/CDA1 family)